jgi:peptidoglycan-associated lipoprotein
VAGQHRPENAFIPTTLNDGSTGAGGNASASTRATVEKPAAATTPSPPRISDAEFSRPVFKIFSLTLISATFAATHAAADNDALALAECSNIKFTIEGHGDERGSEKCNFALGNRRANSAKT